VAVVGSGLAALFLAFELSRRTSTEVALLASAPIGFDWPVRPRIVPHALRPHPSLVELAQRSGERYEELVAGEGFGGRLGRLDGVVVGRSPAEMAALSSAPGAETVGMERLVQLVGHLDPTCGVGAVLEAGVTALDTERLPWELASRAASSGVSVLEGCRVTGAEAAGSGWTLRTTAGATSAPLVVDATPGAEVLAAAGIGHGCLWHRWERVATDPVQPFLHAQVEIGGVAIAQSAQGEVTLRSRAVPAPPGHDLPSLSALAGLAGAAVEALPTVAGLRMVAQSWAAELVPADGLPIAGPVGSGGSGLYRFGGFGPEEATLVPAAAERLVAELISAAAMVRPGSRVGTAVLVDDEHTGVMSW
jgi:hypothetical protein